jgi:hypothetical protein
MTKKSFFVGMLCIAQVFGLLLAGCDTGLSDGGGGGGGNTIDSDLVGKWYQTQDYAEVGGGNFIFELSADGRLTGPAVNQDAVISVTTSGGTISATATANGATVNNGSASYVVSGTQLTFSNFTGAPNIFQILNATLTFTGGSFYKRAGTGSDTTPPSDVAGLNATAGNGTASLTWTDPTDSDLALIEISWTPDGPSTPQSVNTGTQSYPATGLTNGTPYTFTVKAVDSSGNRSAGVTATATPDSSIAEDTTPPANVSSLSATAGNEAVTLTWTNPTDSDLAFIEITWTPGGTTPETVSNVTQTYTASSLAGGTSYIFTVKAVDTSGNRNTGATATATPTASVKKITFTDIPGEATGQEASIAIASSLANLQAGTYVAYGSGTISGDSLTITLKDNSGSDWTGSGVFYIGGRMGERSSVYTNGGTTPVAYAISSETSTISVKLFMAESPSFVGTWIGTGGVITFNNDNTWVMGGIQAVKGTYTPTGNTAAITATHEWEDEGWEAMSQQFNSTVTLSGNTLTGSDNEGHQMTYTKWTASGGSPNPFTGTWTGTIWDGTVAGRSVTVKITDTTVETVGQAKSTYGYNGNTAVCTVTDFWNNSAWQPVGTNGPPPYPVTVSGNTLTAYYPGSSDPITLTKGYTLSFGDATWEVEGQAKGTYTHDTDDDGYDRAELTVTHTWNNGNWQDVSSLPMPPSPMTVFIYVYDSGVRSISIQPFVGPSYITLFKVSGNDPSNPFVGTWTGDLELNIFVGTWIGTVSGDKIVTLQISADYSWETVGQFKGTYTYSNHSDDENMISFTSTHEWEDESWVPLVLTESSTGTITGNTLTVYYGEGQTMTLTKQP